MTKNTPQNTIQNSSHKKYIFPLILSTAFLDILGVGILIPVFPFLIESFGMSGEWVGYTMSIFAAGMFTGGFFFGKWSDKHGRKTILQLTIILTIIGYISIIFSPSFLFFAIGRFVAGLGGAGIGVTQAYVSDISEPHERTKKMGLIGAMFGLGFLIGPAIGGILSAYGLHAVAIGGTIAGILNLLLVALFLPEPQKHVQTTHAPEITRKSVLNKIFFISFLASFAFAPVQGISTQYYVDRFNFSAQDISHVMIVVGLASIVYQALIVSHVRKFLHEKAMVSTGSLVLVIVCTVFALISNPLYIWFVLPFFPLGFGSIQPALGSMVAKEGGKSASGKYLGINNSWASLGSIFGPLLSAVLYARSIQFPFFASAIMFFVITLFTWNFLNLHEEKTH